MPGEDDSVQLIRGTPSNTAVSDTSNWRNANSYPYPAWMSAWVNGEGSRLNHCQSK